MTEFALLITNVENISLRWINVETALVISSWILWIFTIYYEYLEYFFPIIWTVSTYSTKKIYKMPFDWLDRDCYPILYNNECLFIIFYDKKKWDSKLSDFQNTLRKFYALQGSHEPKPRPTYCKDSPSSIQEK